MVGWNTAAHLFLRLVGDGLCRPVHADSELQASAPPRQKLGIF